MKIKFIKNRNKKKQSEKETLQIFKEFLTKKKYKMKNLKIKI